MRWCTSWMMFAMPSASSAVTVERRPVYGSNTHLTSPSRSRWSGSGNPPADMSSRSST
jgi:hypothetical protein